MRHFATPAGLCVLLCANPSWGQAPTCHTTAEQAAQAFVQQSINNPRAAPELLTFRSLASYRARLEQLLDARYSPDSDALRSRLLGSAMSTAQMRSMSHTEFVAMFMAAGAAHRPEVRLSELKVSGTSTHPYLGDQVTVTYRIAKGNAETPQERTLSVSPEQGCWKLQMPVEAWARLDEIANILKTSRIEPQFKVLGTPRATLRVAAASATRFTNSTELKTPNGFQATVWVANSNLLTEADLVGVSASWDCAAGLGSEDATLRLQFSPRGANIMTKWSKANMGTMLAVVIDDEVRTAAIMRGVLAGNLSVCLPRATLEEAESLARRLTGQTQ